MATARQASAIAEACRQYLDAHERRNVTAGLMTASERAALAVLLRVLNGALIAA